MSPQSILLLFACVAACAAACGAEEEPALPALPSDPGAVIVRLAIEGGFTPEGAATQPAFEMLRDGRLKVGAREDRLDAQASAALLRFLLVEQDLPNYDAERVKKLLDAARSGEGGGFAIADAPDLVLTLTLASGTRVLRSNAAEAYAGAYPEIAELTRLARALRRLGALREAVLAGGVARTAGWLAEVNERLVATYPGEAPLLLDDLRSATAEEGGAVRLTFYRSGPEGWAHAEVLAAPDAAAQISVERFRYRN